MRRCCAAREDAVAALMLLCDVAARYGVALRVRVERVAVMRAYMPLEVLFIMSMRCRVDKIIRELNETSE